MNATVSSLLYLNSLWGIRICGVSKGAALKDDRKSKLWWFAATRKGEERTLHSDLKLERNSKLIQTFKCRHMIEASRQTVSRRTQSWNEVPHRNHQRKSQPVNTQSCGDQFQGTCLHTQYPESIAEQGAKDLKSQMNRELALRLRLLETSEATSMKCHQHEDTNGHIKLCRKKVPETSALHQELWAMEQGWEQERWSSPGNSAPIACPELNSQPWKHTQVTLDGVSRLC